MIAFVIGSCAPNGREGRARLNAERPQEGIFKDSYGEPEFEDDVEDFWEKNGDFGIARVGTRLILVSKSAEKLPELLRELSEFSGKDVSLATEVTDSPVDESFAYDVTEILPPKVADTHLRYADNLVNCWNYALFQAGVYRGISQTRDTEWQHWLQEPLMTPVTKQEDLRTGDLIAYRSRSNVGSQKTNELHGVMYVSKNWVLSKNGAQEASAMRLMNAQVVHGVYLYRKPKICSQIGSRNQESCKYYVEAFRPMSLDQLMSRHSISPELRAIIDEFTVVEKASTVTRSQPLNHEIANETDAEFEVRNQERNKLLKFIYKKTPELYKKLKPMLNQDSPPTVEQFLIKGFLERAKSIDLSCELGECD
jgi:hypothetical protein